MDIPAEGISEDQRTALTGTSEHKKVLITDDETLVRTTLGTMLEKNDVILAKSGECGIAEFKRAHEAIDLVLVDYEMPEMRGDEVLHKLRRITTKVPLIMMSGNLSYEKLATFTDPPHVFLRKPFLLEELWDVVESSK